MQAYVLSRYGGPQSAQLRQVPIPVPGEGEILVRVRAAGLNPVDYKFREGKLRAIQRPRLPMVLGCEFAGVVEGLGRGVTAFAAGDRVFARVEKLAYGAFAEYVCVQASLAARMPDSLDFVPAAGVPLAGLTALQCLREELRVESGQQLFISGGAGGVGTFAIQLAKWLGARVTTTASPRGEALVRRLGADRVVDYTQEDCWRSVGVMDGALDLVGGEALAHCFRVVRPGGTVVSVAGIPEPQTALKDLGAGLGLAALFGLVSLGIRRQAAAHHVRYRYKFMHPSGSELALLADLIDQGILQVVIDRVFPFEAIAEAFAYLEGGHAKGKVVVDLGLAS